MFTPQFTLKTGKSGLLTLGFGLGFRLLNLGAGALLLITAFWSWPPFWIPLVLGLVAAAGSGYVEEWTFGPGGAIFLIGWGPFRSPRGWDKDQISGVTLEIPSGDRPRGAPAWIYRLTLTTEEGPQVLEVLKGDRHRERMETWGKAIAGALAVPFQPASR